jgi:very-short-patch-repair endonuclease
MQQAIHGLASEEPVDRRIARCAAAQHGVLSRSQAIGLGVTRSMVEWRLATGRWEALHPAVYRLAGTPETWRQRLLAACLAAGASSAASHRSAAVLRSLPEVPAGMIEISVPNRRRVRLGGALVHHVSTLSPVDVIAVDAIPTTTVTRTLIDLAGVVPLEALEEALDDALRRRLTSLARLRWRLAELGRRGRPGAKALGTLIDARAAREGVPESVLETRFLRLLRRAGLRPPTPQYEVRVGARVLARVDFAYPDIRLAIEIDGYQWHSGRAPWERDLTRRNTLTTLGWRLIHVTWSDVHRRPETIVGVIAGALESTPIMPSSLARRRRT